MNLHKIFKNNPIKPIFNQNTPWTRIDSNKKNSTRIKSKTIHRNQATIHKSDVTAQGSRTNHANRAIKSENMPRNHIIWRRFTTNSEIYTNLIGGNTSTNQHATKLNNNKTGSERTRNRKRNKKFDLQKWIERKFAKESRDACAEWVKECRGSAPIYTKNARV